jgi:hypothetical protein
MVPGAERQRHEHQGGAVTNHVHDGSDPDCDRCWDVVIDQRVEGQ